jgi:hypothetical protein
MFSPHLDCDKKIYKACMTLGIGKEPKQRWHCFTRTIDFSQITLWTVKHVCNFNPSLPGRKKPGGHFQLKFHI